MTCFSSSSSPCKAAICCRHSCRIISPLAAKDSGQCPTCNQLSFNVKLDSTLVTYHHLSLSQAETPGLNIFRSDRVYITVHIPRKFRSEISCFSLCISATRATVFLFASTSTDDHPWPLQLPWKTRKSNMNQTWIKNPKRAQELAIDRKVPWQCS